MGLFGMALLTACTDEAPGPQFANNPIATRAPTVAMAVASPTYYAVATPAAMATPSSISELLTVRGAPDLVYAASDSALWSIAGDGESTRLFQSPANARILAIDPGPSSRQVAVLLGARDTAAGIRELLIVDSSGEIVKRVTEFPAGAATPVPERSLGADLVDWSPQGDRILVAFSDGALYEVSSSRDETPVALQIGGIERRVVQPAWSPTGEAIAFISASANSRERSLNVYRVTDGGVEKVVDSANGRFVVDFVWMPDGVSLLFTEGGELAGAVASIDLWQIGANGSDRELLVSAGTVAPVARITAMQPSPDGRSVAYAVVIPGPDGPSVDSVWVRDLESRVGYRISLPTAALVERLSWTNRGLVISALTRAEGDARPEAKELLQVARDGDVSVLWAAPAGAATPVAGTPAATPASS
jgi:hypothetical protein